jgi:hypothetical protein
MPKRTSKPKLDAVQNARRVVLESVGEPDVPVSENVISQVMAAMGAKGGRIGGKRRLETMTDAQRTRIAKKAANARWSKTKKR